MSTEERAGRDPSRKEGATEKGPWVAEHGLLPFSLQEALPFLSFFWSLSLYYSNGQNVDYKTREMDEIMKLMRPAVL